MRASGARNQTDLTQFVLLPQSGPWSEHDFDVFDGERDIGRIYLVDAYGGNETWFWDLSFQLTGRKSYWHAASLGRRPPSRSA